MEQESKDFKTSCCPRFAPEPWDEKEVKLEDRLFVKDRVRAFLHIPLNFGRVMKRNMERIQAAGAAPAEPLMLCDERSLWRTEVHIAVEKEVPGAEMVRLSGTFLTKVFEGPYRDAPKWIRAMRSHVESKGKALKRLYTFYTTCPRCAKAYGKNYAVIFAQI